MKPKLNDLVKREAPTQPLKNLLFVMAVSLFFTACNQPAKPAQEQAKEDPVKKSIDAYNNFVDAIENKKFDEAAAMMTADAEDYVIGGVVMHGRDSIMAMIKIWSASVTNAKMHTQQIVSDGEYVMVHYRSTGTVAPNAMGMTMKGGDFDYTGIELVRYNKEGLCTEHWDYPDMATYAMQTGMKMEPPATEKKK